MPDDPTPKLRSWSAVPRKEVAGAATNLVMATPAHNRENRLSDSVTTIPIP